MLWKEALFMGFILYTSGGSGKNSICAFKGSSVNLSCTVRNPIESMKWYTVNIVSMKELPEDGFDETYNIMGEENNFTLMIKDVNDSHANSYCCRETADNPYFCWQHSTVLQVTDLQVKVFPTTEGHTVTLMCSTSCPLTEKPEAYIWYKNREFLYEDWSPWYQELVSSEEAVRYSCAIKGYEDLRAPEVSVDSVTETCFTVTYAEGRMCSYTQTSVDESCSITYPTDVHLHWTNGKQNVILTCNTSCPRVDPDTAYSWYWDRMLFPNCDSQDITLSGTFFRGFSCAVKGNDDLLSDETCVSEKECLIINYVRRRICALEGSSVEILSVYSNINTFSKMWYKIRNGKETVVESHGRVAFHDNNIDRHTLKLNDLKKNDSAEYTFAAKRREGCDLCSYLPGVMLVVTDLRVTMTPSAVVTEGERVTLTCTTSCPLNNTNYIWYFNGQPLTLPENQTKHLLLAPVRIRHSGNYSCAVQSPLNMSSSDEALTVKAQDGTLLLHYYVAIVMNGVKIAALALIPLVVFVLYLKMRKMRNVTDTFDLRHMDPMNEGLDLMVMSPAAHREHAEQEDTV